LRLDGESLYQIRNNGWLELGFKEDYFVQLLESNGLKVDVQGDCNKIRTIFVRKSPKGLDKFIEYSMN
jgi:hypothetical protein